MDRRLLAAAYDRSAEGYDERFRALQRVKFRAALSMLPPLKPGALALDAGGGTGLFAEFVAEEAPQLASARWVVLDLSVGMLRKARARVPLLVAADLACMPFRQARFDLIVAFTSVLDDAPRALRELQRLVAANGALCVSFLADEAPATLRGFAGPVRAGQDQLFLWRNVP